LMKCVSSGLFFHAFLLYINTVLAAKKFGGGMTQNTATTVLNSLDRDVARHVWRAAGTGIARTARTPTGFASLDQALPDGGWPKSTLIELLVQQAGIGELRLLRPALKVLAQGRCVALVEPPHVPNAAAYTTWGLPAEKLLWIKARKVADALWTAEQILRNGSVGALLFWQPQVRSEALRRLLLAAQSTDATCFLLRPLSAEMSPSPSPLRIAVQPAPSGVSVWIKKRRGPTHDSPLYLPLDDGISAPIDIGSTGKERPILPKSIPSFSASTEIF
jgi:protein ImuA